MGDACANIARPLLKTFVIILLMRNTECTRNKACPTQPITVTVLALPPYAWQVNATHGAGIAYTFMHRGLEKCFAHCKLRETRWNFVNDTVSIRKALLTNSTDLAFPIMSSIEHELDDGDDVSLDYYAHDEEHAHIMFETLIESPGLSYVIHMGNLNMVARRHIVKALLDVWPVVVYCILLAGISGILVWAMEFKLNRSEFPKNFFHGSYEGFWWAFVSMTTVGYGDKTPKSVWGRAFGVCWILIGLVVIAIFTAAATGALQTGMQHYSAGPNGKRVGVLEDTDAGAEAVRRGANVTYYSSFAAMHHDLDKNELDGLLLDRYEAAHLLNKWNEEELRVLLNIDVVISYKVARIQGRTEAMWTNTCLKSRLARHDRLIQKVVAEYVGPVQTFHLAEHSMGLFSAEAPSTVIAVGVLVGVFGGLVLLGTLYQCLYRKIPIGRRKSYSPRDDTIFRMQASVLIELRSSVKVLSDEVTILKRQLDRLKVTDSGHVNIYASDGCATNNHRTSDEMRSYDNQ